MRESLGMNKQKVSPTEKHNENAAPRALAQTLFAFSGKTPIAFEHTHG